MLILYKDVAEEPHVNNNYRLECGPEFHEAILGL